MNEYDSILKEKKKYEDPAPVKHSKLRKYIIIDFFVIVLILIISYIIYFQTILSQDQIFYHDINTVWKEYQSILTPLKLDFLEDHNYNLEGNLQLNDLNYNYSIMKDQNNLNIELSNNQEETLQFLKNDSNAYIKLSTFRDEYLKLSNDFLINQNQIFDEIKKIIVKDKLIKKIYLENKQPIVEIDLELTEKDIQSILGEKAPKDQYNIIFTFKNNALTNHITSMKIVINNKTKNKRDRITIQNNTIDIQNNKGSSQRFTLSKKNQDITLKIYKNDTLYSVLNGTNSKNKYTYTYQVIDKIYNLNLEIINSKQLKNYKFSSNIEKSNQTTTQEAILTIQSKAKNEIEELPNHSTEYQKLLKEEKEIYQTKLDTFQNPLQEFIKEYEDAIN